MGNLTAILTPYLKKRYYPLIRFWAGERPDARDGEVLRAIAAHVGYPTAPVDPITLGQLRTVGWQDAATIMAKCATGLVYSSRPRQSVADNMKLALKDLAGNAQFFTNVHFGSEGSDTNYSWAPISTATIDAGVIGYDDHKAFIFWAEDED